MSNLGNAAIQFDQSAAVIMSAIDNIPEKRYQQIIESIKRNLLAVIGVNMDILNIKWCL